MSAAHDESRSWPERARSSDDALAKLIRLSRNTAHEVSNALTAVLGYMDLAAGQLEEETEARDAIEKAARAAHAAASSIQSFSEEVLRYHELHGDPGAHPLAPVASAEPGHASEKAAQAAGESEDPAPGSTGLVLFAVADTFIRSILSSGLKAAGNEVIVASGFEEVVRLCEEHAERHPVLVVDSALRGVDKGAGVLRIREKHPSISVVLMSTESTGRLEVDPDPSLVVLHKPFPIARLLAEINRCRWENGDDSP